MAERSEEVLSLELPCDPEAPAIARAALARHEKLGWAMGDGMLVVSELVTNAVLYSGCGPEQLLRLALTVDGGCVRILVDQPGRSAGSAHPRHLSELTDAGVGLMIVDALVQRWGAERDDGYRFWAEIALNPAETLAGQVG
jgi:anti-sigma regulatory factor (Ser/Thr protein kinase)